MGDQPGHSGINSVFVPKKKRQKKSALTSSEKMVIINLDKLIEEMWPRDRFLSKKDVAVKTAKTAKSYQKGNQDGIVKDADF